VAVTVGIFTLAGVLLGGLVTTYGQLYLEKRRELHAARAEQRALRAAKRQVAAELFSVAIGLREFVADPGSFGQFGHLLTESAQWKRHAAVLANDDCYLPVEHAYLFTDAAVRAIGRDGPAQAKHEAESALRQVARAINLLDDENFLVRDRTDGDTPDVDESPSASELPPAGGEDRLANS
jgi:hypothetical protein